MSWIHTIARRLRNLISPPAPEIPQLPADQRDLNVTVVRIRLPSGREVTIISVLDEKE